MPTRQAQYHVELWVIFPAFGDIDNERTDRIRVRGKCEDIVFREDIMTTLREWLNRLRQFDPDDWGEITQLQTAFSEEELNGELEAEIAFDTVGGTVEHVTIRLIDKSQDTIVDLDYTVFQLDIVPLTDFIRESVFGTDEESETSE